jgi:hypothetical protein
LSRSLLVVQKKKPGIRRAFFAFRAAVFFSVQRLFAAAAAHARTVAGASPPPARCKGAGVDALKKRAGFAILFVA